MTVSAIGRSGKAFAIGGVLRRTASNRSIPRI
jgi:hypothetical protein